MTRLKVAMNARTPEAKKAAEESYATWLREHEERERRALEWYKDNFSDSGRKTRKRAAPQEKNAAIELASELEALATSGDPDQADAITETIAKAIRRRFRLPVATFHGSIVAKCVNQNGLSETAEAAMALIRPADVSNISDPWGLMEHKARTY